MFSVGEFLFYSHPEQEHYKYLMESISTLTCRERIIICFRYFKDMTLRECSDHLDLSRERIRQIQKGALIKLRKRIDMEGRDKYE